MIENNDNIENENFFNSVQDGAEPECASFLEPIEQNFANLYELCKLCNSNNTVTFLGAGTSKSCGIADWEEVMRVLMEYAKDKYSFEKDLGDSENWPSLAEEIYSLLDSEGDESKYCEIIEEQMQPSHNTTTLTLVKMILALDIHLTTNFDKSLENAYEFLEYLSKRFGYEKLKRQFKRCVLPDFGDLSSSINGGIVYYLHGHIERKVYIFKSTDYDKYYPSISNNIESSSCIEDCIRHFYGNRHIVFVGFSFEDAYLRKYVFRLAKDIEKENRVHQSLYRQSGQVYPRKQISHFLIIDTNTRVWEENKHKIFDKFKEFNIYPVVYKGGQHIFLEKLFESLGSWSTI